MTPSAAERERAMQPLARDLVRRWLRDQVGGGLGEVGREAIRRAADVAARLSRPQPAISAEPLLRDIEGMAAALGGAGERPRRWWGPRETVVPPDQAQFAALVDRIDRQRDDAARAMIVLAGDRARFVDAERALDDALSLLRVLRGAVESAMREIRGEDPARAERLQEAAAAALIEREQDIVTQLAITRQGLMTLDLVIDNQTVLDAALERARTATLSVLQVALAARRATEQSQAVTRQTEALRQLAGAAEDPAVTGDHARRMLDDAVAQARAALTAMTAVPGR